MINYFKSLFIERGINYDNYYFYNNPKKISRITYKKRAKDFISSVSNISSVLSIYQVGEIYAPGISDLDFVVVIDDKINIKKYSSFMKEDYLVDKPRVVNQKIIKNLYVIKPYINVKCVYGEDFLKRVPKKILYLPLLFDLILERYPRYFTIPLITKKVDTRRTLSRLYHLYEDIVLLEKVTGKTFPSWKRKAKRFGNFRCSWFKIPQKRRYKQLLEYISVGAELSYKIVIETAKFLNGKITQNKSNSWFVLLGQNPTIFMKNYPTSLNNYIKLVNKTTIHNISILPIELSSYLSNFSTESQVGKFIHSSLYNAEHIPIKISDSQIQKSIRSRFELIQSHISWIKDKNLGFGAFFSYGYTYYNSTPLIIKNLLIYLRDQYIKIKLTSIQL